jgi:cell division protein YceG involved in septum cleavage
MIAIFILLICAAPTLRSFTGMYLEEKKMALSHQKHHLALLIYAKLTEHLYKGDIPIESFKKREKINFSMPELGEKLKKSGLQADYRLIEVESYTPKNHQHPGKYLMQLDIHLDEQTKKMEMGKQEEKPNLSRLLYIEVGESKETEERLDNESEEQIDEEDDEADS